MGLLGNRRCPEQTGGERYFKNLIYKVNIYYLVGLL